MNRTLSGATTPDQSVPGSYGNKGLLRFPQSSSVTGASPSDCLVSYSRHSLGESHPSAEKQSVYSAAGTDWTKMKLDYICHFNVWLPRNLSEEKSPRP